MKKNATLKLAVIMITAAALLFPVTGWGQQKKRIPAKKKFKIVKPAKPCGIRLDSLSTYAGAPGDVFYMNGQWGRAQGTKLPCINKGGQNRLIVLAWTSTKLKVKIPAGLSPGLYKVGCYCSDPYKGKTYGTTWKDFKIIPPPKKVDVDITNIWLDNKCRLWLKHTNHGEEPLNIVLRERVWVNGRMVDDSTETIALAPGRWITHGVGADPGVIISGSARIRAQIDVDGILRETNERNNSMTKTVHCKSIIKPVIKLKR